MAGDTDDFELRAGRMRSQDGASLKGARRAIRQRGARSAGPKAAKATGIRPHQRTARVRASSALNRRVVVKARIVAHAAGAPPLAAHVSYLDRKQSQARTADHPLHQEVGYLARESSGEARYAFYDAQGDVTDARAITDGWRQDARHFRLIVSPEDGATLGDLRPFVRELMGDLSQKLGTRLEWVAIDHWDTDNPHTHVLVRGRRDDGGDLVIPRRVISHDIRERAQEIVTRALGPRSEHALAKDRERDIAARRLTPLDRELLARARDGIVRPVQGRSDLMARLERLETWSLARQRADGGYTLAANFRGDLETMGERAEIERLLAPDIARGGVSGELLAADPARTETGRLILAGPADDLAARLAVIIETGGGHLRYAILDQPNDHAAFLGVQPGALVTLSPRPITLRPADHAIGRIARLDGGAYTAARHLGLERDADPDLARANERRLEAMRRAGLVERTKEGAFLIPEDYEARALAFESRRVRSAPVVAAVASYWTLEEQAQASVATHLDRVIAGAAAPIDGAGRLGAAFQAAIAARRAHLVAQGVLPASSAVLSASMLERLRISELAGAAERLAREFGRPVRTDLGEPLTGTYARRIDLAQGRMAVLLDAGEGRLAPWSPALERFAGRPVSGRVRSLALGQGVSVSWSLRIGRARAIDR